MVNLTQEQIMCLRYVDDDLDVHEKVVGFIRHGVYLNTIA